ncbi:hypothetical protein PMZ80_009559 [Knufia obscura]|uniref:Uncharacterized protein n=1 Tax=Knufia obscura TaxID=1635080 RepID=A0ABR0RCL3_9EURO|nr:hypothetical protein PMZ80_009559 [Knufia obscura]
MHISEQFKGGDEGQPMRSPMVTQTMVPTVVPHRQSLFDRYTDSWCPELSALVLSSACTIAIYAVLGAFDGRPNPSFKYGLTLNALISILATTSKVALIFAVSNALSQLKWVWFNGDNNHRLLDAELFDEASRGPLGAIKILGSSPARSPVTLLGALLILIALAFDPFVQQIVSYDTKLQYAQTNQAAMIQAQFPSMEIGMQIENSTALKTAINAGFFTTKFEWEPSCSTGNCTWPDFQTITWCGRCEKDESWTQSGQCSLEFVADELSPPSFQEEILTDILVYDQYLSRNCTYRSDKRYHTNEVNNTVDFRFHYSVNATDNGTARISEGLQIDWLKTRSVGLNDISWAIDETELKADGVSYLSIDDEPIVELSFFKFELQQDLTISMSASSCYLDICHQRHNLSVENGVVRPNLLEQERMKKSAQGINLAAFNNPEELPAIYQYMLCYQPPDQPPFNMTEHIPYKNNQTLFLTDTDTTPFTFCDRVGGFDSLNSGIMESYWTGNETATTSLGSTEDFTIQQEGLTAEKYWTALDDTLESDNWTATSGPHMDRLLDVGAESVIDNVAASLTKILLDPQFNINGSRDVNGELGTVVTLVNVRWEWLILPAALCLGGIAFVSLAILATWRSRAPLWKSSLNALLYHGIKLDESDGYAPLRTIPDMDRHAAATRAWLDTTSHDRQILRTSTVKPHG